MPVCLGRSPNAMTSRVPSAATLACLALLATSSANAQGSVAPPYLVMDTNPGAMGSDPGSLVRMGGFVYYSATDDTHGNELWRTDGTASGTSIVRDINPGGGSSAPILLT